MHSKETTEKSLLVRKLIKSGLSRDEAREAAGLEPTKKKTSARHIRDATKYTPVKPWRCHCGRLIKISRCLACAGDLLKKDAMQREIHDKTHQ